MSTNFPGSLDTDTELDSTIAAGDVPTAPSHAGQHSNANQAIKALEAKVGIDSSAVTISHDYKLREMAQTSLYPVNGVTYALTRAGIAAAITAATAIEGRVLLCGNVTLDGTSLALPSRVTLDLGGHKLTAPSSGSTDLITVTGTIGSAVDLGTNATMGAKTIDVATGLGSSFAAGDIVRIYEETSRFYCQLAEVRSVASDTLTLVDTLKHAFTTANGTKIRKVTPVTGARIINGRFDGNGNTDTTRAIHASYTDGLEVVDCEFTDFPEAAIRCETGLHSAFRNLHIDDSGSGSESDLMMFRQTDYQCIDVHSHGANGFGPQSSGGAGGEWYSCVSHDANGRALKLAYEGWTNMVNCRADGARGGYTGISVTLTSHDCDIIACKAQGNASYGFMLDSTIRCRLIACSGQGNGSNEATHDDIDGTPDDNQIIDCHFPGGINDSAASSDLITRGTTRTAYISLPLTMAWDERAGAAVVLANDAHGSLSTYPQHVDQADADASHKQLRWSGIMVPADFLSGMKIGFMWSSGAASNNCVFLAGARETLDNATGHTTSLNEGAAGILTAAAPGVANTTEVTTVDFDTAPTIGRQLTVGIDLASNHANDSNTGTRTIWAAWLQYTAKDV